VSRVLAIGAAALALAAPAAAARPPDVVATAYVVQNGATGEVLAARRAHARVPMASITKLMTVLVALERADPDDVVVTAPFAATVGESSIGLSAGERISVGDLVRAALVQSANDAAWALATHVGGGDASRFVALMNAKARALGLRNTRFVRPDGLDAPGHVSSARDVTLLARIAMRNGYIRSIVDDRVATIAGARRLHTWNDLLSLYPGTIGVKTGHTAAAGWSQVAAVRSPGFVTYVTVLGSPSRSQRNADLIELAGWAQSLYRSVAVVATRRVYARADVGYGREPLAVVARDRTVLPVRVDRPLREVVVAPAVVALPVRANERVGTVSVYSGARLVARAPLVAARSVDTPSMLARAWASLRELLP